MQGCKNLKVFPTDVNLESLEYTSISGDAQVWDVSLGFQRTFSELHLNETTIREDKDCFFIGNIFGFTELVWIDSPIKYLPSKFHAECVAELTIVS